MIFDFVRSTGRKSSMAIVALVCLAAASLGQEPDDLPELNAKVVEFAKAKLGEKVGNGECTTLVSQAYREVGAKRYPTPRGTDDFVWGEPVESFREALPGDVVQFRDAVFDGRSRISGKRLYWHYEFPHHTAIIGAVEERGKKVTFLHQNTGKPTDDEETKRTVKEESLPVGSLKSGKVWIYRPAPRDEKDESPFR